MHLNVRYITSRDYEPQIERTLRFSNTYFQSCIHETNLLDVSTRSCQSISEFKREPLGRIRPPKRPTFNIYDIEGIKLLTRLRVEFSDLSNHRYRHNFHCPVLFASVKQESMTMNISSCIAQDSHPGGELSLTWFRNQLNHYLDQNTISCYSPKRKYQSQNKTLIFCSALV